MPSRYPGGLLLRKKRLLKKEAKFFERSMRAFLDNPQNPMPKDMAERLDAYFAAYPRFSRSTRARLGRSASKVRW